MSLAVCLSRPIYQHLFPYNSSFYLYYSTWARLWEFVLGGLIIPFIPYSFKHSLRFAVIPLFAFVLIAGFMPFDTRIVAIFVTGGIIYCATQPDINTSFNYLKPLQCIGKFSFSIYLWHWPILVIRNYYSNDNHPIWLWATLIATCVLGCGAYYLFEKRKWKLSVCTVISIALACFVYAYITYPQVQHRFAPTTSVSASKEAIVQTVACADFPDDILRKWKDGNFDVQQGGRNIVLLGDMNETPRFVFMGDSHAYALSGGLHRLCTDAHLSGYYVPCYVTPFDNRMAARENFRFNGEQASALMQWLAAHPELETVVIVQRWSIRLKNRMDDESLPLHYDGSFVSAEHLFESTSQALEDFCARLKEIHKNVILVSEMPPIQEKAPYRYALRCQITGETMDKALLSCTKEHYDAIFSEQLKVLDMLEEKGLCRVIHQERAAFSEGPWYALLSDREMMLDDDHLSTDGACYIVEKQKQEWLNALCPPLPHE